MHRLKITGILLFDLLHETFSLIFRIIQLGKTVSNFTTTDKKFKPVCYKRVLVVTTRQW